MSGSADPWAAFRVPAAPAPAADARPTDDPWGAFRQVAVPEGEPMPAAPQRTVGEQALRGVGLGLRDVVEGAAALPGMAVDALTYPVRAAGRALGYQMEAPTTLLSQGLTAAGLPVAETGGEQMVSAGVRGAASALPTLGAGLALQGARAAPSLANALAGGPVGQAVGGAASEMAATGARQNELGPVAELGAGLLGGVAGAGAVGLGRAGWEAGRAMGTPFFESGRQRMTADVLLRGSSNPETLAARLEAGADPALRLPGSPVTTAQQARDSGLLPIEQGMRTDVVGTGTPGGISPAARFREIEAQRNAVRTNALLDLGDGSSPDARGVAVRGNPAASGEPGFGLAGAEQTRRAAVSRAYEAIDPEGTSNLPLGPVRAAAAEAEAKYFGELSGDMPGALRSAIEDLGAAGDAVPWRSMQGLRQRLGEIAGNPDPTQARAAAAAKQIRQSIDDTAERAAMPQELPSRPIGPDDIDAGYAAEGAAQHPDIAARLNMPEEQLAARLDAEPGPEGLSLVQYLRRKGGVQNQNDELRTVMGTTRAMPALISGRGLTLDRAAQAAWEAGYLGPKGTTYTPRELLDAVDAELRGLETRYPERRRCGRATTRGRRRWPTTSTGRWRPAAATTTRATRRRRCAACATGRRMLRSSGQMRRTGSPGSMAPLPLSRRNSGGRRGRRGASSGRISSATRPARPRRGKSSSGTSSAIQCCRTPRWPRRRCAARPMSGRCCVRRATGPTRCGRSCAGSLPRSWPDEPGPPLSTSATTVFWRRPASVSTSMRRRRSWPRFSSRSMWRSWIGWRLTSPRRAWRTRLAGRAGRTRRRT
jgi:hypothetical protein